MCIGGRSRFQLFVPLSFNVTRRYTRRVGGTCTSIHISGACWTRSVRRDGISRYRSASAVGRVGRCIVTPQHGRRGPSRLGATSQWRNARAWGSDVRSACSLTAVVLPSSPAHSLRRYNREAAADRGTRLASSRSVVDPFRWSLTLQSGESIYNFLNALSPDAWRLVNYSWLRYWALRGASFDAVSPMAGNMLNGEGQVTGFAYEIMWLAQTGILGSGRFSW